MSYIPTLFNLTTIPYILAPSVSSANDLHRAFAKSRPWNNEIISDEALLVLFVQNDQRMSHRQTKRSCHG
jgi:hypothetical protein